MRIAQHQSKIADSYFMFEHPAAALSWKQDVVQGIPGVGSIGFDQCMLGLKDPDCQLLKKRTKVMSNLLPLLSDLQKHQCDRGHGHGRVSGAIRGHRISTWSQVYPPELCQVVADAVNTVL